MAEATIDATIGANGDRETDETREAETRIHLLMKAFIVSEATFFLALLIAYVYFHALSDPDAARVLDPGRTGIASLLLIASSATLAPASRLLGRGRAGWFRVSVVVTVGLGVAFLIMQGLEWHRLLVGGTGVAAGLFGSTFFTLTGFHGLHVLVGLLSLVVVMALSLSGQLRPRHRAGVEVVAMYWHFVNLVWVAVYSVVYLRLVL